MKTVKEQQRERRHKKIRTRVEGTSARPRLSVFRSNKFIYAQLIDDEKGATLVSATDKAVVGPGKDGKGKKANAVKKLDRAKAVGEAIASLAKEKKIAKAVFDRGGFLYAGRVKALAEGARSAGLQF